MIAECPKSMRFGPCGGVRSDGSCEVDERPCPFVEGEPDWSQVAADTRARGRASLTLPTPAIVVDVRAPATWPGDHRALWHATADALAGCIALIGEHVDNLPLHDDAGAMAPLDVIEVFAERDVPVIATVTGRDRSLDAAESTMRSYRDAGATAIHCVTGDHPSSMGFDRPAHFGAESMTLLAVAADLGIPASVAESPGSIGRRVERLAAKQRAGAAIAILNHTGSPADLTSFANACRGGGATLPLIAPVPMVADKRAALGLASFPGIHLPHGYLDRIIEATDPLAVGLDAAEELVAGIHRSGVFAGANLSGAAGGTSPFERVAQTRLFIERARRAWT